MRVKENNFAFIDGQNLNLGIKSLGWALDLKKFRVYLKEKFNVSTAYFFIGFISDNHGLYSSLRRHGYTLIFKPIILDSESKPKGNVDADLVLQAMIDYNKYKKAVVVTSDGDFYSLIKYLAKKGKLEIVLSPYHKTCSCLLKKEAMGKITFLNELRNKLEYKKERPSRTNP